MFDAWSEISYNEQIVLNSEIWKIFHALQNYYTTLTSMNDLMGSYVQ
jgi:hypothetical protein